MWWVSGKPLHVFTLLHHNLIQETRGDADSRLALAQECGLRVARGRLRMPGWHRWWDSNAGGEDCR